MMSNPNPSRGSVKYSRLRLTCKKADTQINSNKVESISKYFTRSCEKDNVSPPKEVIDVSPFQNTTEIKSINFDDDNDFKTPKKTIKKIAKIFQKAANDKSAITSLPKAPKRKYTKRVKTGGPNQIMQKTLEDNFKNNDVNGEQLQMALALSKSIVLPGLNAENEDILAPIIPTQKAMDERQLFLQQFGFGRPAIGKIKVPLEVNKRKKKSKFHKISPTLLTRTDTERETILNQKIAHILASNSTKEESKKCPMQAPFSELLDSQFVEVSLFSINNLTQDQLIDDIFYVSKLKLPRNKFKCGSLLKKWECIPGRELSPVRCNNVCTNLDDSILNKSKKLCAENNLEIDHSILNKSIEICAEHDLEINHSIINKSNEICAKNDLEINQSISNQYKEICAENDLEINHSIFNKSNKICAENDLEINQSVSNKSKEICTEHDLGINHSIFNKSNEICADNDLEISQSISNKYKEICTENDLGINHSIFNKSNEICAENDLEMNQSVSNKSKEICTENNLEINHSIFNKSNEICAENDLEISQLISNNYRQICAENDLEISQSISNNYKQICAENDSILNQTELKNESLLNKTNLANELVINISKKCEIITKKVLNRSMSPDLFGSDDEEPCNYETNIKLDSTDIKLVPCADSTSDEDNIEINLANSPIITSGRSLRKNNASQFIKKGCNSNLDIMSASLLSNLNEGVDETDLDLYETDAKGICHYESFQEADEKCFELSQKNCDISIKSDSSDFIVSGRNVSEYKTDTSLNVTAYVNEMLNVTNLSKKSLKNDELSDDESSDDESPQKLSQKLLQFKSDYFKKRNESISSSSEEDELDQTLNEPNHALENKVDEVISISDDDEFVAPKLTFKRNTSNVSLESNTSQESTCISDEELNYSSYGHKKKFEISDDEGEELEIKAVEMVANDVSQMSVASILKQLGISGSSKISSDDSKIEEFEFTSNLHENLNENSLIDEEIQFTTKVNETQNLLYETNSPVVDLRTPNLSPNSHVDQELQITPKNTLAQNLPPLDYLREEMQENIIADNYIQEHLQTTPKQYLLVETSDSSPKIIHPRVRDLSTQNIKPRKSLQFNQNPIFDDTFANLLEQSNVLHTLELASTSKATTPSNSNMIVKMDNITPMQNYMEMDTPKIVNELAKFGVKALKRRRGAKLLEYLYEATHPCLSDDDEAQIIKRRKKIESQPIVEINACDGIKIIGDLHEDSDFIFQRHRSKKIHSCALPLHIAWHNFISCNPALHEKILLYEPLQVESLYEMLKAEGMKYNIQDLIGFLDKKCITIRMNQGNTKQAKKIK